MSLARRVLPPVVLCAALLAGCSESGEPARDNGSPRPGGDRDATAVAAALHVLDPCALMTAPGLQVGPHSCMTPDESVRVDVGAYLDPQFRAGREETVLDGVRVTKTHGPNYCTITVLAGADLGIGVTTPTCDTTTTAASAVVTALADPDAVALPSPQPDSCDLLTRAAGDRLKDLSVRYGVTEMGLCQAMRKLSGEEGDGWASTYSVRVVYGLLGGVTGEKADDLAGTPVTVYDSGEDCEYSWKLGASPATDPYLADQLLRVRAPDCDEAAELATEVLEIVDTPPASVEPQRPITIAA